jgi:hypothetical protein
MYKRLYRPRSMMLLLGTVYPHWVLDVLPGLEIPLSIYINFGSNIRFFCTYYFDLKVGQSAALYLAGCRVRLLASLTSGAPLGGTRCRILFNNLCLILQNTWRTWKYSFRINWCLSYNYFLLDCEIGKSLGIPPKWEDIRQTGRCRLLS